MMSLTRAIQNNFLLCSTILRNQSVIKLPSIRSHNVIYRINHNSKICNWHQSLLVRGFASTSKIIKKPPVVTIMGHVDHGKTTLLDYLRNSQIVQQEFGGITQHIGAFVVPFKQKDKTELVTFLDTPGHAAFASMRQRGANVTDIVVLVVACEDGVMEQTLESIKYAKASQVPIIVAINKIDKFSNEKELQRNIIQLRKQLIVHDVVSEQDGGEVQLVPISALKGLGVEELKESILALAETLELKADLACPVSGTVIESSIHSHRGKLCTVLVQEGELMKGDYLVAGSRNWAKVRALFDERNQLRQSCGPGTPIQVIGWREEDLPAAGDPINQVQSELEAKTIVRNFQQERLNQKAQQDANVAAEKAEAHQKIYHEKFLERRESGFKYGRTFINGRGRGKEVVTDGTVADQKINLILKCDVDGSLEALLDILDSYDKNNKQIVKLDVMHYGVGLISENDYNLAAAFPNSVIYGFNVKLANQKILLKAKQHGVSIKLFNVIYHLIDDLKVRLAEQLPEVDQEVELGQATVLQEFIINESKKTKTHVAGCQCTRGSLKSSAIYRLIRNNELVSDGMLVKSLKHLKDEVKEVERNQEFGISFLVDAINFKQGDTIVGYEKRKCKQKLKWEIRGF